MGAQQPDELFDGEPVLEFSRDSDRRSFLRWAGLVGAGTTLAVGGLGTATALGAPGASTGTKRDSSDIGILNYALTLEYLEADFYNRGLQAGLLDGRDLELVTPIRDHEQTHVTAVRDTITSLGGTPVEKPRFTYPRTTFVNRYTFLWQASNFEELGVNAYHGQVPLIHSPDVLAAAAAIAGVESRHAGILATLTFQRPFPRPIEQPKSKSEVLAQAGEFIESGN